MTTILALTCGRPDFTVETWRHNFANHGAGEVRVFWYDNGSTLDELRPMMEEAARWRFDVAHFEPKNKGIAAGLNWMMKAAFSVGASCVCTMANDIKEPENWLRARIDASNAIPQTGVVAVPVDRCARYGRKNVNGYAIEEGTVIGNWLITRAAWGKVGGFCSDYGIYGPLDIDYCERLRAAGLKYYYLSELHANHIGKREFNPIDYQAGKMAALNAAWPKYKINQKLYREGKKIYQDA